MLRLLGNIIWFLLGGFVMGLAWWFFGLLALSILIWLVGPYAAFNPPIFLII